MLVAMAQCNCEQQQAQWNNRIYIYSIPLNLAHQATGRAAVLGPVAFA